MTAHAGPSESRFLPADLLSVGAVFTTWVLPGAGHWMLGHTVRGVVLLICIVGLWTTGLLVGGIGVIDHRHPIDEEFSQSRSQPERRRSFWFFGQSLVAPSLVVHQVHLQRQPPALPPAEGVARDPNAPRFVRPTFAHPFELGQLFTTVAGMLNLLAMIDLLWRIPAGKGPSSGGVRARPRSSIPPPELPPETPPESSPESSPKVPAQTSDEAASGVGTSLKTPVTGDSQASAPFGQADRPGDVPSGTKADASSGSAAEVKPPSVDGAGSDVQADPTRRPQS